MAALTKATEDLERMYSQFKIQPIEKIKNILPWNQQLEMGIVVAHRDLDKILNEKKWAIVSGRGPSGPLHLGHVLVFKLVAWFQKIFNVPAFIPLSDDEKFVFGKISSLDDAESWALENAKWIATLGFDHKKTRIYISSHHSWVYKYALKIARHLTLSTVKGALGVEDSKNIGIPFYAAVQIVHILQPTIDFGTRTLVPIALDQDVFMRLTRDVAEKLSLPKPASVYVKFLPGLQNVPMSSSIPETAIYVTDDEKTIFQKIMRAYSGGAISTSHQRKLGGDPEKCVIFEWLKAFYFKSITHAEQYANACRTGQLVCGYDCKHLAFEAISKFLADLRTKAEKVDLEKFLWRK
ncbi:MAG: tryptophan--tRNA ligase [Candidatus Njordarchaeota archaeon]